MVNTKKFSEFTPIVTNGTNSLVGLSNGDNAISNFPLSWTTAQRPVAPTNGTLGYNTDLSEYEYWDTVTSMWFQLGTGDTGTVTLVDTGTGLTGGPITETGTISFAPIAANSLWANITAGIAVPTVIPTSTFLISADNLSDVPNKATARTNLGLAIGVNVEAWSATLDTIAALGKVPLNLGGTNANLTASLGAIPYSTSTALALLPGNITTGIQYLSQTGTGIVSAAPVWSTISGGDITGAALTKVDDTNVTLTLGGSPTTALLRATSLTLGWTGQLDLTRGGTNASLVASDGGIVYSTATAMAILAGTATARQMLQSGASAAPAWSTAIWPATTTINRLLYSSANNVVNEVTAANSAILASTSAGVPTWVGALTNGQLLIGSTGATPAAAGLSAGPGISIATGPGTITISGTGSGIGWTEVTGTSQAMTADNGYVANNAGLVTFTLPVTAAFGTAINVIGKGAGGWKIAQNAGQSIQIGSVSSTVGATGSVSSTNQFDSVELICTTADTIWTTVGGIQGELSIA